ncbi:MAG: RNA polymerase sigma-I factor [Clostridia bacterium]|nr:RNA polymerase sigma-I factor [Clostridia bacterium]
MPPQTTPDRLLEQARSGDTQAREELIRRFTPFVMAVVSRLSGRYISMSEDDEASVGLMAFNEAIDSYNSDRASSFLTLAEIVIRRRLVDYFRRERRHAGTLSLQAIEEMSAGVAAPIDKESLNLIDEIADRRREIERYQKELAAYGITFAQLAKNSPRHRDARDRALAAARVVVENPLLRQYLVNHKALPLKALEKSVESSRKTLERHRQYIIAIAVMLMGNYEYLTGYIGQKGGGLK